MGVLTLEFDDGEVFKWSKVCAAAIVLVQEILLACVFSFFGYLFFEGKKKKKSKMCLYCP